MCMLKAEIVYIVPITRRSVLLSFLEIRDFVHCSFKQCLAKCL